MYPAVSNQCWGYPEVHIGVSLSARPRSLRQCKLIERFSTKGSNSFCAVHMSSFPSQPTSGQEANRSAAEREVKRTHQAISISTCWANGISVVLVLAGAAPLHRRVRAYRLALRPRIEEARRGNERITCPVWTLLISHPHIPTPHSSPPPLHPMRAGAERPASQRRLSLSCKSPIRTQPSPRRGSTPKGTSWLGGRMTSRP